jgi:hypothetical protein
MGGEVFVQRAEGLGLCAGFLETGRILSVFESIKQCLIVIDDQDH